MNASEEDLLAFGRLGSAREPHVDLGPFEVARVAGADEGERNR